MKQLVSVDTIQRQYQVSGIFLWWKEEVKICSCCEYGLVGPMLATFIASLAVRYRMSRPKIQEFLHDWVGVELSIGTLDALYPRSRNCLCSGG